MIAAAFWATVFLVITAAATIGFVTTLVRGLTREEPGFVVAVIAAFFVLIAAFAAAGTVACATLAGWDA